MVDLSAARWIAQPYDSDRWVHIPLDYAVTPWAGAAQWAQLFVDSALEGRDWDADAKERLRLAALDVALFPAEHVTVRFWHFPLDGVPGGWIDIYVQSRVDDGVAPSELMPELGFVALEPVIESVEAPNFERAERRLSIGVSPRMGDSAEIDPLPRAEWLAIGSGWVYYAVTVDADPGAIDDRLADGDALLGGFDPRAMGAV